MQRKGCYWVLGLCCAAVILVTVSCRTGGEQSKAAKGVPSDKLPRVIRDTLDGWGAGDIATVETSKRLNANFVHSFPRPPGMKGLIPVPAMKDWLAKWSQEVAELHKAGVFASASVGSTCFNPEIFKANGLDPELYYARDVNNKTSSMLDGGYGKELMTSCYSNPYWTKMLTDNVMAFADAGFDGIWYDVGGYYDHAVLYCQCENCKKSWQEHLAKIKRDPGTPLPTRKNGSDYTQWVNCEFLKWRWDEWVKWENAVQKVVKSKYPKFVFCHNLGVKESQDMGFSVFLHSTTNLYDYVHWEEWQHGTAPYSVIPAYLLGLAAGGGKQVVLIQNDEPARNDLQHKIFLAEGYASGGTTQIGANLFDINGHFMGFIKKNEDCYRGTKSMANAAIVYSWWSQAIYAYPQKLSPAYRMGQMLLDMHVPFDCIVAERDLSAKTLTKYKTIILPDLACMTDSQIEAIRAFVKNGGGVILTANTAKYDENLQVRSPSGLEKIAGRQVTGSGRIEAGAGKIAYFDYSPETDYWKQNPRDFAVSKTLPLPTPLNAQVKKSFDWVFGDTLPIKVNAPATTAALPHRQKDRILLHFVNYNVYPDGKELHPEHNIGIELPMPEGARAAEIKVISPDFDDTKIINGWKIEKGVLRFNLDELQTYSVAVIELKK